MSIVSKRNPVSEFDPSRQDSEHALRSRHPEIYAARDSLYKEIEESIGESRMTSPNIVRQIKSSTSVEHILTLQEFGQTGPGAEQYLCEIMPSPVVRAIMSYRAN